MATIEKMVVELEAGTDLTKAMSNIAGQLEAHDSQIDVVEGCLKLQADMAEDLAFRISKNGARLSTQIDLLKELSVENKDAARCIKGLAEELTKTNKRMDALVADREKHQRRLDDRLEEVIESTQEAEKAFLVRIERAEKKRDAAYGEIAKLKRAAKGDQY